MGLMSKIKGLVAMLGVVRLFSVLKWVPGLGPVAGIASTALAVVRTVVAAAWDGLVIIFTNPVTLVVVGFVGMTAFAYGLKVGSAEGRSRVAVIEQERNAAHEEAKQRLAEALEARRRAEEAEEKLAADIPVVAPKSRPSVPRGRPERVRAKPANTDRDRFCVPGFSPVFGGC